MLMSVNDSRHWRDRAGEMRALSAMMSGMDPVATILRLADDYDMLAARADIRSYGGVTRGSWQLPACSESQYSISGPIAAHLATI
jgi:hypothetical protein